MIVYGGNSGRPVVTGVPTGEAMPPFFVLVVDDDPSVLHLLTLLIETDTRLALAGTATDGRAALDTVQHGCPDAIVCDVRMPGMDGLQALPLLHRDCPHTVIVMYSSEPESAAPALLAGAAAIYDKGSDPARMLDDIVELCARR
jgi:two-component system, chemotaxis family, protein-glutamate methylesterase/glutaminase